MRVVMDGSVKNCLRCGKEQKDLEAVYCAYCGEILPGGVDLTFQDGLPGVMQDSAGNLLENKDENARFAPPSLPEGSHLDQTVVGKGWLENRYATLDVAALALE